MEMLSADRRYGIEEEMGEEVAEARQQLFAALTGLSSPLGELVRSQLEYSISDLRIALLLVAARRPDASGQARQQRILLSSALEMLYLALSIHKLLLTYVQNHDNPIPERAWTGSVILAGDYCFSRSAIMAAQTNLPRVVDIFAQALKTVNEELLRRLLPTAEGIRAEPFDEEAELISAGLHAATVIAELPEANAGATIALGQKLVIRQGKLHVPQLWAVELPGAITSFQRPYWRTLFALYLTHSPA